MGENVTRLSFEVLTEDAGDNFEVDENFNDSELLEKVDDDGKESADEKPLTNGTEYMKSFSNVLTERLKLGSLLGNGSS